MRPGCSTRLLAAGRGVKLPEIPHNSDNGGKKWLRPSSNRCRATLRQSGRNAFKWSMSPVSVSGNKET